MSKPARIGLLVLSASILLLLVANTGHSPPDSQAQSTITPTSYNYLPVVIKQPTPTATIITPTFTATATHTATATRTATATATSTATTPGGPCLCDYDRYNCPDFSTQAQAQACYNYCVAQGAGDVHHLDSDGDGVACESLL